jgi:hypothetical protein
MGYILKATIGEHHYQRDLGRGYSSKELAAAKQSIRQSHYKNWGKPRNGKKFKFEVVFK